jgi:2,3-diaminopropionate biosynthesis protein SbnA
MSAPSRVELQLPPALSRGILSAVGNTPLVQLERIFPQAGFSLYAKLEMLNPGGSSKDRSAVSMVLDAYQRGIIGPRSTIIESSSGNLGVALAQVCRYLGLRFICVVDIRTTPANLAILKVYGVEVDIVSQPDPVTGDLLTARVNRAQELRQTIGNSFWVNQYANLSNAAAHHQTMGEIHRSMAGRLDYLFVATSTCGTLRGCAEYIRSHQMNTQLVAVDAVGSVIFGDGPKARLIPGHGASRTPELYQKGLESSHMHVSDLDCVVGCFRLLRREAIFAGGSSGGVIMAVDRIRTQIPDGSTCVVLLCDRGERYLDTVYSETWVKRHFGEVEHLWE